MDLDTILDYIKENKKKVFGIIVLLVILIILIYHLSKDSSHKLLYNSHRLFYDTEEIIVGFEKMPTSEENIRYTFSVFVRLNNLDGNTVWNEKQSLPKYIIQNNGAPNIVYYRESGDVVVEIAYKDEEGSTEHYEFKLDKFPMQRWTGICVVVDGIFVKIYLDGKLSKVKKMLTIPWKSQGMLNIGKQYQNFNGYIGMVDYYNRAISEQEVLDLYNKRIKSLPSDLLTYEQLQYKKRIEKEKEKKLNKVKKV
jgi:hypothetical protein